MDKCLEREVKRQHDLLLQQEKAAKKEKVGCAGSQTEIRTNGDANGEGDDMDLEGDLGEERVNVDEANAYVEPVDYNLSKGLSPLVLRLVRHPGKSFKATLLRDQLEGAVD